MMLNFELRRRWPVEIPEADDFPITGLQSSLLAFSIIPEHNRDSANTNCFSSQEHDESRDKLMSVRDQARFNYRIASKRWEAARHALEGTGSTQKFLAGLSPAQMNSYRLLREWWDNESYDSHITSLLRDWIENASILHLDIQVRPRIISSRYNYLCFCLWCEEFGVHTALSDVQLYDDRQSAAGEAARHRIAMQVVHAPEQLRNSESRHSSSIRVNDPNAMKEQNYRAIPMSAEIEPGAWISHGHDRSDLPYYLWNKTLQCTVTTDDLEAPDYTAISHTWGRWRSKSFTETVVHGVPWLVPENTLFNAHDLPFFMAQVPTTSQYIWFDVVCIPQNMSHPDLGPRAQIEIANQANIFRRASLAIAWFNWVPEWSGFRSTIEWLALVYANDDEPGVLDLGEQLVESN